MYKTTYSPTRQPSSTNNFQIFSRFNLSQLPTPAPLDNFSQTLIPKNSLVISYIAVNIVATGRTGRFWLRYIKESQNFNCSMKIIFTGHAEKRIMIRKITKQEVVDAVKSPDKTIKKYGKYYYQKKLSRGVIEIVAERTESNINIITIYWL